jgi:hypothetical protein
MSNIYDNSFYSTTLDRVQIDYTKFALTDTETHHIRIEIMQYMHDNNFDKYICYKRKRQLYIKAKSCNIIFDAVCKEFESRIGLVDIFAIIIEHFDINESLFYNNLIDAHKLRLKHELRDRLNATQDLVLDVRQLEYKNEGLSIPTLE